MIEQRFWEEETGRCRESWDAAWHADEPYRGANSNMHLVEAFLAAFDATGDRVWAERALRIAHFFVHEVAAPRDWRLPEHFTPDWQVVADYNTDDRAHPFRPYGVTVGHVLEWARLLVHVEAALPDPPSWLLADAEAMFAAAVARGWSVDGTEGFVYTLDYDDTPVVRSRMHWVVAEAISAAAVLGQRTGDERYEHWYRTWWDHAATYFVDTVQGSWHHELDPPLAPPPGGTWSGKPDVYHAYQATRLPLLPLAPEPGGGARHGGRTARGRAARPAGALRPGSMVRGGRSAPARVCDPPPGQGSGLGPRPHPESPLPFPGFLCFHRGPRWGGNGAVPACPGLEWTI